MRRGLDWIDAFMNVMGAANDMIFIGKSSRQLRQVALCDLLIVVSFVVLLLFNDGRGIPLLDVFFILILIIIQTKS